MDSYILASIAIGSVFIGTGLAVVLIKEDLNRNAAWIVRVIVCLGAGFVAAGILGGIEIEGPWLGLTIKAGGPVVITWVFYVVNPPSQVMTYIRRSTG